MYISSLHLRNFRMFGEADLKLNRELCVFVGDNGSGKTTLLDALSIGFANFPLLQLCAPHRRDPIFVS